MARTTRRFLRPVVVANQDQLIELLVARCEERGIATSSIDKLPNVKQPWLHDIKAGRQKSTTIMNMFALLGDLGLQIEISAASASGSAGQSRASLLRKARQTKLADRDGEDDAVRVDLNLTEQERAEIASLMGVQPNGFIPAQMAKQAAASLALDGETQSA